MNQVSPQALQRRRQCLNQSTQRMRLALDTLIEDRQSQNQLVLGRRQHNIRSTKPPIDPLELPYAQ